MADLPPNVTLAQLTYFVTVAEELNFTRAAERLHVSQSPLSQSIRALETNLGVALLERTSRHVELTAAGEALLPAARAALGAVAHALSIARAAGRGEQRLRVGFLAYGACDVIDRSLAAFAAPASELRLETRQSDFSDPTAGLAGGSVDAAFLRLPVTAPELQIETLTSEPRVAVLPAWHPLAARDSISVGDLADEHWLQMPGRDHAWREFWLASGHRDRVTPLLGPEVRTVDEQLAATATGGYVSLAPASVASAYPRSGISYVPVTGIEPSAVAIAWRGGDERASVRRFVARARELASQARPLNPGDRLQAQP
ncbi:MAG TPA: LysR substrate-binding domain-containing protein [Solirubrobacteraceae bacterium]|jgi:DNA-binding transcriptional LysR family regulator|nr:LysR substrate-binding domain-containing protein [Solirubrobacteraceae bacterium]